jgi:hypothetical protein
LDYYVGKDNPVRVVEALVDELGLAALGFHSDVADMTVTEYPRALKRFGPLERTFGRDSDVLAVPLILIFR